MYTFHILRDYITQTSRSVNLSNRESIGERRTSIDYLQKQHEADPLIVSVLLSLGIGIRLGIVDAGEGHLRAFPLPVRCGYRVRAVYPAVGVQDVLGQVLAVYAVDGIADVLASGDDQGERDQQDHGEAVMQSEDGAVDVNMRDFNKALQTAEYVQHLGTGRYRMRERSGRSGRRRDSSRWVTPIELTRHFTLCIPPSAYIFQRFRLKPFSHVKILVFVHFLAIGRDAEPEVERSRFPIRPMNLVGQAHVHFSIVVIARGRRSPLDFTSLTSFPLASSRTVPGYAGECSLDRRKNIPRQKYTTFYICVTLTILFYLRLWRRITHVFDT